MRKYPHLYPNGPIKRAQTLADDFDGADMMSNDYYGAFSDDDAGGGGGWDESGDYYDSGDGWDTGYDYAGDYSDYDQSYGYDGEMGPTLEQSFITNEDGSGSMVDENGALWEWDAAGDATVYNGDGTGTYYSTDGVTYAWNDNEGWFTTTNPDGSGQMEYENGERYTWGPDGNLLVPDSTIEKQMSSPQAMAKKEKAKQAKDDAAAKMGAGIGSAMGAAAKQAAQQQQQQMAKQQIQPQNKIASAPSAIRSALPQNAAIQASANWQKYALLGIAGIVILWAVLPKKGGKRG